MWGGNQSWYLEDGNNFARTLSIWLRGHTSILLAVQTKQKQLHSRKCEAQVHNTVWIHLCPKMKPKWTCVNCGQVIGQKARGTCLGPQIVHHQCKRHSHTFFCLTVSVALLPIVMCLILLTWRIWWAPNNASRWQMEFNSAFKGLMHILKTWGSLQSERGTVSLCVRNRCSYEGALKRSRPNNEKKNL